MTVSSTQAEYNYAGNGSTTAFAFSNVLYEDTSLEVILTSSAGVATTQTLGAGNDYTVTIAGDFSSATVNMVTAPATGETLTIKRAEPLTQLTDYIEGGPFPADSHERGLDRLVLISQMHEENINKSIKLPPSEDATSALTSLPVDRASKYLGFDASKNPVALSAPTNTALTTAFSETLLDDASATAARNTLGVDADSLEYTFSTTTADADPGAGALRFNNATPASVTQIFIDDSPANITGLDLGTLFAQSDGSRILISQRSNSTKFLLGLITAETDGTGYWKLTVTVEDSGTLPDNAADLTVKILPGGVPIDLSNLSQSTFLGRKDSAGTGDIQSMTAAEAATALLPVDDAETLVHKTGDTTANMRIDANGITTATTRVLTMPDEDIDLGLFGMRLLASYSPSSVATLDVTSVIDNSVYSFYVVMGTMLPVTDGVNLWLRTSTDNGSSFDSGASDYEFEGIISTGGFQSTASEIALSEAVGNLAAEGVSFTTYIYPPAPSAERIRVTSHSQSATTATVPDQRIVAGYRQSATAVDAFQLLFSSGNISSGTVRVYGVK